jgi:septal ring factor EnvC (AmiA/AmiB activator)
MQGLVTFPRWRARNLLMSLVALSLMTLSGIAFVAPASAQTTAQRSAASKSATGQKDAAGNEADLEQIRKRIEAVRQTIQADASRRDALVGELQSAESNIQNARQQSAEIRRQRQASERQLTELKREQAATERQIAAQREALAGELRIAYMNGGEEQLKLFLNQQDPAELGRMLTYYGYFGRARAEHIAAIGNRVNELQLLADKVQAETQRLLDLEQKQQLQVKELAGARQKRAQTLAAIQSKLRSRSDQLSGLQREAAALERLLAELRRVAEDFPTNSRQPFDNLRGKLPWPVTGKVIARFGEPRAGGPLKWKGILIESVPGTQVRAPLHGRVEYADWLNGYGYLVVLNHGGGYRSFYGHNEQVYRRVGDMVAAGDVLGDLAERSGGKADLYMEIRKAEQPVDPQKWLRKP